LLLARGNRPGHNLGAPHPLMRKLLCYLATASCLLFPRLATAAEEAKPAPEEAKAATLAWLKLVDDGKYADSWKEASGYFQTMVTEEKWTDAMNQSRDPLGSVNKREFKAADFTHDVPRAPKGDYWVIQFVTEFEGATAIEVVTSMLDKDGKWHVSGYSIKPAS